MAFWVTVQSASAHPILAGLAGRSDRRSVSVSRRSRASSCDWPRRPSFSVRRWRKSAAPKRHPRRREASVSGDSPSLRRCSIRRWNSMRPLADPPEFRARPASGQRAARADGASRIHRAESCSTDKLTTRRPPAPTPPAPDSNAHSRKPFSDSHFGAVHEQRLITSAEQMPEQLMPAIEPSGVSAEEPFHARHQLGLGRLGDEVKVISHRQ